ncbi:MAG: hypothetical protein J0I75_02615 [Hyphomicrobium sp.]|nr:hypothetical protein [Hyphomicrobium sp.]
MVANALRDRLAVFLALATIVGLGAAFILAKDTKFLMPGPLASAHGAIKNCSSCHTKSGSGNLTWMHGLAPGDRLAESKACLTCHQMPNTAFNAHGVSGDILKQSTERLAKIAATTPAPLSARVQGAAFPTHGAGERGLSCATCHQEHKGTNFSLSEISNERCRSCHVVKFDSFDGDHPKFERYPFKKRTQIVYDHEGHVGKHFPEMSKKDATKRIPDTCSTCHNSRADKRVMTVAPFEQTCSGCHLDQITGKDRASGPKGVAFLALPGLDLQTLKKKNAAIGEWPEASEADLTPFMKVMISRTERGRALIKTVDSLNLMELAKASDSQIRAVTNLVWEIKGVFYALITGRASDVLGDLGIGGGAKLSASLIADLTAHLPRDVVVSAQQQWLPNLGTEMANHKEAKAPKQGGWITTTKESTATVDSDTATIPEPAARLAQAERQARSKSAAGPAVAKPEGGNETPSASEPPRAKAGDQTDDLLHPTEEELRAMAAPVRDALKAGQPKGAPANAPSKAVSDPPAGASAVSDAVQATSTTKVAPVIGIESKVDAESWAEYGGWYRQDYAIFYRPAGHKDKFIYSWLFLTGPQAPKGAKSPAAAVFNALSGKEAQGSCTKCHSVDDIRSKGRLVNFSRPSVENKKARFTRFIHEPHFGVVGDQGCLTCHSLEKGRSYLKSYEQGNPHSFASNFGAVKKETCQSCHASGAARQDCVTCHKYHVNGVTTPTTNTKLPTE